MQELGWIAPQAALKRLLAAAGGGGGGGSGGKGAGSGTSDAGLATARVAVRCLAGLLVSLPHFNYASDLLQVRLRTNQASTSGAEHGLSEGLLNV